MHRFRNGYRPLRIVAIALAALIAVLHAPAMTLAKTEMRAAHHDSLAVSQPVFAEDQVAHHDHSAHEHSDAQAVTPAPCATPDCCVAVGSPAVDLLPVAQVPLTTLVPCLRSALLARDCEPAKPPPRLFS